MVFWPSKADYIPRHPNPSKQEKGYAVGLQHQGAAGMALGRAST